MIKVIRLEDMFVGLDVVQYAWTMRELEDKIWRRANHLNMGYDELFRVHKRFIKGLNRVENKTTVREEPQRTNCLLKSLKGLIS